MNKKTEPLMFIKTVATENIDDLSQDKYDSRFPKKDIIKPKEELIKEIEDYIASNKKGKPVLCLIKSEQQYMGIPFDLNEQFLFIKDKEQILKINLDTIKNIKPFT